MIKLNNENELPDNCLVFGYGSLMYPSGVNNRGLIHVYQEHNELRPYMLKGFHRTMSAEWTEKKLRYYGLAENKLYNTFGVLVPMHSLYDITALLYNEAASTIWKNDPMYDAWDITDRVDENARGNQKVVTLLCNEREYRPSWHAPGYVSAVYNNLPKLYREPFLATGGLEK